MQCNINEHEVRFRFIIGAVAVLVAIIYKIWLLAIIGAALIYSALNKKCYVYKWLKIDTSNFGKDNNFPPKPPSDQSQ